MSSTLEGAPAGLRRLFPHHHDVDLDNGRHLPFVIGRLLEEGDRDDLAWLMGRCGEPQIATWVRQRGSRQLSRRSRAFWTLLLDLEPAADREDPLWPA